MSRRVVPACAVLLTALVSVSSASAQRADAPAGGEAPVRVHLVPEPRASVRGPAPDPGPSNLRGPAPTVGERFWITVRTSGPAGYGLLPGQLVEALDARPEVEVTDSERRDGRLRLEIAAFRPGDAPLPEVEAAIVDGTGDTLRVPVRSDSVRIAAVLAPADTVLADIKPLWAERGIPAWVWWLLAALVAALLLLAWWWQRRRSKDPSRSARTRRSAYAVARERIERLSAEPDSPEARIGATAGIGDALRTYLVEAWAVPARERTTLELVADLPDRAAELRPAIGSVLNRADLAKFARVDPGPGGVPRLGERALDALDRLESARVEPDEASGAEGASAEGTDARDEREAAS